MSSQITFESALEAESALGITDAAAGRRRRSSGCPTPRCAPTARGGVRPPPLDDRARSLDQRVRVPLLIEEIERRGGKVVVRDGGVDDLEDLARDHDLVVVSTGRGGLASLFEVDAGTVAVRPRRSGSPPSPTCTA